MLKSKSNLKNSLFLGASVFSVSLMATAAFAQNNSKADLESVIVTGTRVAGMTAADSAAPITVLGASALTQASGTADLRQALGQTVPSFTAESVGGDLSNLALTAQLRGLSSNDTLVLVNGKRRHGVGLLNLNGGATGGGAAADLAMIPTAAIEHAEVLLDGSAAQYGTDAIAGVINFILKKGSSGGSFSVNTGRNYSKQGATYDMSLNIGLPLFDKGFINVTMDKKFTAFAFTGGSDARLISGPSTGYAAAQEGTIATTAGAYTGTIACTNGVCIPLAQRKTADYYPKANRIGGNSQQSLFTTFYNAGYDINDDISLYSFGSWGHRNAKANENYRLATQVIAAPGSNQPCSATNRQGYNTAVTSNGITPACAIGLANSATGSLGVANLGVAAAPGTNASGMILSTGQAGSLYTPGELVMYPKGFTPQEGIMEDDYQYNVGAKFKLGGWDVDAGVGYGKDIDNIYTYNSANRSLFIDTHTSPEDFYDGAFIASQLVADVSATHQYNVGMAGPLNVAVGLEAREDTYQIKAGDAASRYKEGPQSFPGYSLSDASSHSRKNTAVYVDFAVAPIEALQLDVAGRYEHYSDFGDATIGKITARYDFNPQWAVRGTISTGFRAPTLAEEFYSATQVSPTSATVQLPANSPAATLLGLPHVGPEISTQYSAGIVAHPFGDLSLTVDAYSLTLGNRIVRSGTVNSAGGAINVPLVNTAIALQGISLDPTATENGVSVFLNGLSTLTQGVDLSVNYPVDLGNYGSVDLTLAGNYNNTSLSKTSKPPAVITASNPTATFFPDYTLYNFVHSAPSEKIGLTASYSYGDYGVTLRETYYGPQHGQTTPNGGTPYYSTNRPAVGLFDVEGRYNVTENVQFAVGSNNLFNVKPKTTGYLSPDTNASGKALTYGNGSVNNSNYNGAYNPNGGFYYARLTLKF